MNPLANPANPEALCRLLLKLKPDDIPVWGKMIARQMIDHMIEQVRYTNGKLTFVFDVPQEQAKQGKQKNIYTDVQIPRNLILWPLPAKNKYPDLHTAINQLMLEL